MACELSACKTVCLIEDNHDTTHGSSRNQRTEELPCLLLLRCGSEPIADLEVSDESASHRESRADHAAHDKRSHHTARAFQSHSHEHHRSKDKRHERHARHRVGAHDGNGICSNSSEEEGDASHEQDAHNGEEQIALHNAEPEEEECYDERNDGTYSNNLERDVALCADGLFAIILTTLHLFGSQRHSTLDDAP